MEVKARKGKIIAIVNEGDESVKKLADHCIEIPETEEMLVPLLATIPLQLLSYHIAVMRNAMLTSPGTWRNQLPLNNRDNEGFHTLRIPFTICLNRKRV